MRKIALFFATLAMATVLASPAGASSASRLHLLTVGGCQYRSNIDNGSVDQWCTTMAFPAEAQPGDVFNVTVKAYAKVAESQNATVSFYGLGAAGLTLVGNGDTSAVWLGDSFSYTDYYYGGATNGDGYANGKGDSYSFQVADDQAPGTYSVFVKVKITDDGYGGYTYPSWASEVLTYTIPAAVPPVVVAVHIPSHDGYCSSIVIPRPGQDPGRFLDLTAGQIAGFDGWAAQYPTATFTPALFLGTPGNPGETCTVPWPGNNGAWVDQGYKVDNSGQVNAYPGDNIHELYKFVPKL